MEQRTRRHILRIDGIEYPVDYQIFSRYSEIDFYDPENQREFYTGEKIDQATTSMFIDACHESAFDWSKVNHLGILKLSRLFRVKYVEESILKYISTLKGDVFVDLKDLLDSEDPDAIAVSYLLDRIANDFPDLLSDKSQRRHLLCLPLNILHRILSRAVSAKNIDFKELLAFSSEYISMHGDDGSYLLSLIHPESLSNDDVLLLKGMNVNWSLVSGSFSQCLIDSIRQCDSDLKKNEKALLVVKSKENSLLARRAELEKRKRELEESVENAKMETMSLEDTNKSLNSRISQLKEAISSMEKQNSELSSQLEKAITSKRLNDATSERDNANASFRRCEREKSGLEKRISETTSSVKSLQASMRPYKGFSSWVGKRFIIRPLKNRNLVIDTAAIPRLYNRSIIIKAYSGTSGANPHQIWKVDPLGRLIADNNSCSMLQYLKNKVELTRLDVNSAGRSIKDSNAVRWLLDGNVIRSYENQNHVLTMNGGTVTIAAFTGENNQQWELQSV